MIKNMPKLVGIVGERVSTHAGVDPDADTSEYIEDRYFNSLTFALERQNISWKHIPDPTQIPDVAHHYPQICILPLWSGHNSRNRKALVPAICEAHNISYSGADAFASIVCQDKALGKIYAREAGLKCPQHKLYVPYRPAPDLGSLTPPYVVKPAAEGGSMGIGQDSLVRDPGRALKKAEEVARTWRQPTLIEEFRPGREVSLCLIQNDCNLYCEGGEVIVNEDPNEIITTIFDADKKKSPQTTRSNWHLDIRHLDQTTQAAKKCFGSLGKVDYMRIDGRLDDDEFWAIELTPDVHLGDGATFAEALKPAFGDYPSLINEIVKAAALY